MVGNMMNEMAGEHANRVVGLGVDMLETLTKWNEEENPTNFVVQLKIGVHTDSLVSPLRRSLILSFSPHTSETDTGCLGGTTKTNSYRE